MKKLLSLLSVLTISGTAVPTTIAASSYQKKENLNREKRQNNKQNIVGISEIIITTDHNIMFSGIALENKLYFGSGNNIYEYDPATGRQKIVITTNNKNDIFYSRVMLNNKLYFGLTSNKFYEYDPATGRQKIFIMNKENKIVIFSKYTLNNRIYFVSINNNVYEYDPAIKQKKLSLEQMELFLPLE